MDTRKQKRQSVDVLATLPGASGLILRVLLLMAAWLPLNGWAGSDGVFTKGKQYYVHYDDYTSYDASTKTYVYTQFAYENADIDLPMFGLEDTKLKEYEGYKLTLVGANVGLGWFFKSRFYWGDNVSFPNGGKIIIEFPKQETPDYTQPCFSYFSCYVNGGGVALTAANPGSGYYLQNTEEGADPNKGYWQCFSGHKDSKGNTIDQSGKFEITVPAGTSIGCGLALYGMHFYMGDPQKILVSNSSSYWWIGESVGEPKGRDLEYNGAEQNLLQPHSAIAYTSTWLWINVHDSGAEFHYRWRKTDHDGSSPTEWSDWSTEQPAATEVGRYEMQYWARTGAQGMYGDPGTQEEGEAMESPIVSRILRTITDINDPKGLQLMYNFEPQKLVTAGTSSQGTYWYRLGEQGAWTTDIPEVTDVGTYKVYWYIAGDPVRFYHDVGYMQDPKDSVEVTIVPLDLATTAMTVTNNSHFYDGKPHKAQVKVMCGTHEVNYTYYDIFYGPDKADADETDFGDYDVTVKAIDGYPNFTGQQTKGLLSIGRFDLSQSIGSLSPRLYTSLPIRPTMADLPTLYLTDNVTEIPQTDFEITAYGENTSAGTGSVTITAKDNTNYTGSRVMTFDIQKRDAVVTAQPQTITYNTEGAFQSSGTANATLALATGYSDGFTLSGVGHTLASIMLTSGQTASGVGTYASSIIPANAKIHDGNGQDVTQNYNITYTAGALTVTQKAFSTGDLTVGGLQEEYPYTGEALTPSPIVRDLGRPLSSADYDVTYSDNNAVGDAATVTVTFKGNYEGTVSKTFVIYRNVEATKERSGDANYYRTYYNASEDLEVRDADTDKFAVYKAAISADLTKVVLTEAGTVIPSGTPVMLVATESPIKLYKATSGSSADFSGNVLVGTDTHTAELDGSEHIYIFNGSVFIWATEGTMESNRAFISGSDLPALKARRLTIVFSDDETTEISGAATETDEPEMWYDLQGRRIDRPTRKGLYILNGRKVVVK